MNPTEHHITFPAPQQAPTNLYDEDEVEGETILLGKEIQIKRSITKAQLRKAEGDNDFKKCDLRSQYKTYLEALEKYEKKEKIKYKKDNEEKCYIIDEEFGVEILDPNYGGIGKWLQLKKIRDKRFKKKWTAILEPLYDHLNLNAMRVASVIEKQRKERALHFI